MSSSQARPDIERYALERFAFLVEEKRFRRGRKERNVWYTKTNYVGGLDLGISVLVEYLDPHIAVDLIRTQQGKLLPDWGDYRVSERWRRPFRFAVQNVLNVPDERLEQLVRLHHTPQPWTPAIFEGILAANSGLVKDHLDALSAYPPEILFPAPSSKR